MGRPWAKRTKAGWGRAAGGALLALAGLSAQAATFSDLILSLLPPNSGTAVYTTPDAPGTVLTVQETSTQTMAGSDLFGYSGLWLGSDGTGGRYTFSFNAPIQSIALSFVGLTAFAPNPFESLTGFVSSVPSVGVLSAADGTLSWAAGVLRPLEEDSHGVLTFTANGAAGFSSIRFDHLQPDQLQGFVIDRIDITPSAVPEPSAALLWAAGLGCMVWLMWRRRSPLAGVTATALVLAGCGGNHPESGSPVIEAESGRAHALALAPGATNTSTTQRDAARLADQATFGATETLLTTIRTQGVEPWLAAQFAATGSSYTRGGSGLIHTTLVDDFCAGKGDHCWRDNYSAEPLLWDFYRNATTQPDQLRQRVAFALQQIVVISNHEVAGTYGLRFFHNMLLTNAFGNYREVLRRTALSPLMGDYLDHVNNDKLSPNENFARELLQLFAIGTCRLNSDGTLQGGQCAPTYDNQTVREYAFALTGFTYPAGGVSVWGCWPTGANCTYYQGDMVAKPALADNKARTLLSGITVPATRTPTQALDLVLNSLMAHPSMAPFISRQLIQHLVKSNPTPAYVQRVATSFRNGRYTGLTRSFGTGVNGDLTATVAAVLLDPEARTSAAPLVAEKLREPALLMTGAVRALNGSTDGEAMSWWWGDAMRQHVFYSPSVFNFYSPTYPVQGTRLVGPAFGIYNVNTAFARLNFLNQLLHWGGMDANPTVPGALGTHVNLAGFEADATDPAVLVSRLSNLLTGGRLTAAARQTIASAVATWTPAQSSSWRTERVRTAAYLVLASPAYQVLN